MLLFWLEVVLWTQFRAIFKNLFKTTILHKSAAEPNWLRCAFSMRTTSKDFFRISIAKLILL